MTEEAVTISGLLGIDNTSDPMVVSIPRKSGVYCREIDNVDIDDNYKPHRRDGYGSAVLSGTSIRSLWGSPSGAIALFGDGTNFKKLNTDYSSTVLVADVVSTDPFSYVEVGNFVYFSNSSIVGYIDTRLGTSSAFPDPAQTFKTRMVGGQILEYHYNRLYAANGYNQYFSDPTILTRMDTRKNANAFSSRITMMKSVVDGMYVSDSEKVYFQSGKSPVDFISREVLDVPAIEGMSISTTVKKRKGSTKTVFFITEKGPYEGFPEGIIVPKQGGLFKTDGLYIGTILIKDGDYQQLVAIGRSEDTPSPSVSPSVSPSASPSASPSV